MPGWAGVPVVTMLVCFYFSHARLRVRTSHPAFPAPSVFGREVWQSSGTIVPRECGGVRNRRQYERKRSNPVYLLWPWTASSLSLRAMTSGCLKMKLWV
jgi:hypothetical protein